MPQVVEISLRVPSLRMRANEQAEVSLVDNTDVRFTKHVELPSIPKTGDTLTMVVGDGEPFQIEVVQSDWHDDKNMFVVACRYGRRSLTPEAYRAIANASDWTAKTLL
jgi:hypothetical protein